LLLVHQPNFCKNRNFQKVVKMCGQTAASPTEAQEVRFLCVLAAVIGQKPDLGTLFCSAPSPSAPGSPSTSGTSTQESTPSPTHTPKKENLIMEALLKFIGTAVIFYCPTPIQTNDNYA
jgi:hypothetical protein